MDKVMKFFLRSWCVWAEMYLWDVVQPDELFTLTEILFFLGLIWYISKKDGNGIAIACFACLASLVGCWLVFG
jgi:hypothetical protein